MSMVIKTWVYDPQSGGVKIPNHMKPRIRERILAHAQQQYAGKFNSIDVRFRSKFCYIDAYTEPFVPEDYDPELFGGISREERIEQLRKMPTHLCRLRYFGNADKWSLAYYSYAQMNYKASYFDNGSQHGTPEEAFDTCSMYLE